MSLKEELEKSVTDGLAQSWRIQTTESVPVTTDLTLLQGAQELVCKSLEATVLYVDLAESSLLATEFQRKTAAKVVRSFIFCMSKLIKDHGGEIRSFDGDRVLGIFVGPLKNSTAAKCALKMNWAMINILRPRLTTHFQSLRESGFEISHGVGIDTGSILAVRAGPKNDNDLVWIGRAPNLAAKLSDLRDSNYATFISDEVFKRLTDDLKFGGTNRTLMWEPRTYAFAGESISVHRSNFSWRID